MSANCVKRILVYTHNSIGLGHAFRTLAVMTGIKKWRPDIDLLVISGTSIPQIFFREGIEVIKLPSVKIDIDQETNPMVSRYLSGFGLEEIFDFRQNMIMSTFDFFQPDVLIIEHNMTGQMSELIPLLMKKWMRKGGPMDFTLVHICRGIMKWVPLLRIPYQNPRHRSESINIGALYDFMYVLEDRNVIDINKQFLGNDPELEKKITYLGKITTKIRSEIAGRSEAFRKFGLSPKKTILVSLGRSDKVCELSCKLLELLASAGIMPRYQVAMVVDPYLADSICTAIKTHPLSENVRFLSFLPDLVDLVAHSELIISRAGYNTINEILLTGARALIIPESHGGGEQELRAKSVRSPNVTVMSEDQVLKASKSHFLESLLKNDRGKSPSEFDKYAIGKRIIEDLEGWRGRRCP